jgi:hypothetical protein
MPLGHRAASGKNFNTSKFLLDWNPRAARRGGLRRTRWKGVTAAEKRWPPLQIIFHLNPPDWVMGDE